MKGIQTTATAVLLALMLMSLLATAHARNWVAINDDLMMDPESIAQQGALRKVTIQLRGNVHNILIFCKKRALLFNEKMVAASDTPAGTDLVNKVCEKRLNWYDGWR